MFKGWGFKNRRQKHRIQKSLIVSYYEISFPGDKQETTQIKNISLGGVCFVTPRKYAPGTKLAVDMKTPYLTDAIHIEGKVLESLEKIKGMIYETRLVFEHKSREAELILQKLVSSGIGH